MSIHEGMPAREIIANQPTRIITRCLVCGDVEVPAHKTTVHIFDEGPTTYGFVCPHCGTHNEREAPLRLFAELLTTTVDVILEDHCV